MKLKKLIESGKKLKLVGVTSPIEALFLESMGLEAAYLSGAGLALSKAKLDEGLLTREEVASKVREIREASNIPLLVDCDTGLLSKTESKIPGVEEKYIAAKTAEAIEKAGADGIQIEDQVRAKKRCGQLPGKELVSMEEMFWKVRTAKLKSGLFVVARTDARSVEGLEGALWRAHHYVKAGADAIFPEALESLDEFRAIRDSLPKIPLVANLTTHGKTPETITAEDLFKMGYQIVLFPVPLRILLKKYEEILKEIKWHGSMKGFVVEGDMLSRDYLNEFIKRYSKVYKKKTA